MRLLMARLTFYLSFLFLTFSAHSFYDTPDFWNCLNRVNGLWKFGQAPYACDVTPLLHETATRTIFANLIFNDYKKNDNGHFTKYLDSTISQISAISKYYITMRKPNVSAEELSYFIKATLAVAYQESYMTHYRNGLDGHLKVMRGDSGHGHGIMQVDDRWHYIEVESGRAWDFINSIIYSLEEYYAAWEKAPSKNCVDNEFDFLSRARAAYSAYNGGPSKICRFTNPDDLWARNDVGFLQKITNEKWKVHLSGKPLSAPIDVKCYVDTGNSSCNSSPPSLIIDKHDSDYMKEHDIFEVGSNILLLKNINLRDTPGGTKLSTAPKDTPFEILDYIFYIETGKRYYMIKYNQLIGYVYAGASDNFENWTANSYQTPDTYLIANEGDSIVINNEYGINVRDIKSKEVLTVIHEGETAYIEDTIIKTENNNIYYQITKNSQTGYIYGGQIFPEITAPKWATAFTDLEQTNYGRLADGVYLRFLKKCARSNCSYNGRYIYSRYSYNKNEQFKILEYSDYMVKIESIIRKDIGWLYTRDIIEI